MVRIWGDTIRSGSAGHVLQTGGAASWVILKFEFGTTQARYVAADSGAIPYGVRVSADTLASIGLGSIEAQRQMTVTWFYTYPDTTGAPVPGTAGRPAGRGRWCNTPRALWPGPSWGPAPAP